MTDDSIATVPELLAHSMAIEMEAMDSYNLLADQMEVHNNLEVSELFRKLADAEGHHIDHVKELSVGSHLPDLWRVNYKWRPDGMPEAETDRNVHYLMTPYHAIELALQAERKAVEFFQHIVDGGSPEPVREMAAVLLSEEKEHVTLLEGWLQRYPEPDEDWDHDPDPPTLQE